ncbi:type I polyketide synthase [Mycolicibacterium litorale]|uniref:type I polyketide synthase n=1 Tax=Mycolicibacterium litorale TaxID=758802 RepID=UPI003CE89CEA
MAVGSSDRRAIITEALRKIDDLSARLAVAEQGETEPIAVVGLGCRLPGGVSDPDGFWQLLQDGRSGVVRVPAQRWDADAFYSADNGVPGTICTREGGFLTSWLPDEFDAEFFGISPREAAAMDPQQRLLMEVAWEALEHAGIPAQSLRGTQTSVFVGLTAYDYMLKLSDNLRAEDYDAYVPFGNAANFAAGRLSYFLGVRGPAVVVDTACSSSLVSIHLACQSLRRRESDTALAAGVNLMLKAEANIALSRWGMLAPDGRCKTFDASADGYVRSEGCGVVVLKRLSDAERDGDRVLALVRGSAVNQDGASSGQTVPNGPAQQALLWQALAASGLSPADVDYVEAHGTGTALGDPIELDALSAVFGDRQGAAPLVLGSVKTNLGHLESGAGVAGFIKTVLSVRYGFIPKHLHFEQLTPHAGPGASEFTIAAEGMEWPAVSRPRRAGVSSFGVSGTNAHVIVEQAPAPVPAVWQPAPAVSTLVVSGKSGERIAATAAALGEWMSGPGVGVGLADVAHTLNHHRTTHPVFATVTARDHTQAIAGLQALAAGETAPGVVGPHDGPCGPGTVFVYSGQGSQWAGMGRRLLADEPAFAAAIDELEPVFVEQVGFSLREVLTDGQPITGIERIQPVLVAVQLALTALWRSHGVNPDAVIGHSMGEVSAAVVAGALTPAEGLRVIATRSRLMSRLAGQGAMALLELDAHAAETLIADHPDVTVAVYAAPGQTVIAGPPAEVDALIAVVAAQSRLARRIEVDVASHHPTIDPILPELRTALADLAPKQPTVAVFSTVDREETPAFDADHWVANLRRPVQFCRAVAAAGREHTTFIEVSPHPLLAHAINDSLTDGHHHTVATLHRDHDDTLTFHTNLNTVHTTHPPCTPHPPEPHHLLPATPWLHRHHWIHVAPARRTESGWETPVTTLSAARTGGDGPWVVIADAPIVDEIVRGLGEHPPVTAMGSAALADESSGAPLLEALAAAGSVLYAPSVGHEGFDADAGYRLFDTARRLTAALVTTATPPTLYMVSPDSLLADADHPAGALLWSLGRVLALSHPDIWGGVVELDDTADRGELAEHSDDAAAVPAGDIKDVWRTCAPAQRFEMLRNHVGVLVSAVMGLPSAQSLNPSTDFFDLGMDSLMSVILQRALAETLGELLPQTIVFDYPTVELLAGHLATIGEAGSLTEAELPERVS